MSLQTPRQGRTNWAALNQATFIGVRAQHHSIADLTEGTHCQRSVAAEPARLPGQQTHGPACRADKLTAATCRTEFLTALCSTLLNPLAFSTCSAGS